MRIRYWIASVVVALSAILAVLGIKTPDFLNDLWYDEPAPIEAPVPFPSVQSHVSQMEGPKVQATHEGMVDSVVEHRGLQFPDIRPMASPSQRGCTTRLLSTNFSSRAGVKPRMFVLHYTVSANRVGLSDVEAIFNFFNRSSSQASSHYIIDFEGNCWLIVAEGAKAWTQGAYNEDSISIEFIALGSEPASAWDDAGLRKGALVVSDALKRWDIPLRRVNPEGCDVIAGVTDHDALECGNTHHDVQPNFPWKKFWGMLKEAHAECVRFRLSDNGNVLAQSRAFRPARSDEVLPQFLDFANAEILRRLTNGDDDAMLRRVKTACA